MQAPCGPVWEIGVWAHRYGIALSGRGCAAQTCALAVGVAYQGVAGDRVDIFVACLAMDSGGENKPLLRHYSAWRTSQDSRAPAVNRSPSSASSSRSATNRSTASVSCAAQASRDA